MLSVLLAEIGRARRRRAVWLIFFVALGILTIYSWTNHSAVADTRRMLESFEADPPQFESGPGESETAVLDFMDSFAETIERRRVQLSARQSHRFLLAFFGTATGVIMSAALASTLMGADFRWRYWKTLASHEPRRWRLVLAKLVTLWFFILIGLVVILGLSYPLNSLFARLYDVRTFGGVPQAASVADGLGRAWLVNCSYGTVAAAIVLVTRSNLAGLGGTFGFTLADGLISQRFSFLGYGSPAQQVAALFPQPDRFTSFNDVPGVQWFAPSESMGIIEVEGNRFFSTVPISIPDERAALILGGWVLVAVLLAVWAMKGRDLPP